MEKLLFDNILAGTFVSLFLFGIIVCVIFIVYAVKSPDARGKPFMRFFNISYYREIREKEKQKSRPKRAVYRYPAAISPPAKRKYVRKRRVTATARPSQTPKTKTRRPAQKTKPAAISRRVYFVNGKPTLKIPEDV